MNASESTALAAHTHRIYSDYLEMPGLRLTSVQGQRLWGLEPGTCAEALQRLVEIGFLRRTADGQYARVTDGTVGVVPVRMAKAQLDRKGPGRLAV